MAYTRLSPGLPAGTLQGILLLLPVTMAVMGVALLAAVLPAMQQHFETVPFSNYLVALVLTVPSLGILFFSAPAGWLSDRVGRKALLIWSMVVYALIGIAPVFLDNIYLIILTRCGVGLCEAIVMTVSTTLISDYFEGAARIRWMARQMMVASIAALPIFWMGGQLGSVFGWRGPFGLYGYSLLLAIAIAICIKEPKAKAPQECVIASAEAAQYVELPRWRVLGTSSVTMLASVFFYSVITQNGNALVALGVRDPSRIGALTMLAGVGVLVGALCLRNKSPPRIGGLLALEFALIGIGFFVMSQARASSSFIGGEFIQQIGCGLIVPTLLVWATQGMAFHVRGLATGIWTSAFALGQSVSSLAVTYLSLHVGGVLVSFLVLGAVALIAAALALASRFARYSPIFLRS